jgi:hypothetical protein
MMDNRLIIGNRYNISITHNPSSIAHYLLFICFLFTPALSYPQEATNEEQYNEAEIIVLPEASIEEALDTPDTVTREPLFLVKRLFIEP